MAQALYRKYRSKTLVEIVGQTHITSVLQKSLDTGATSHAYLFTGPRGVGKTSVARILANNLNGLKPGEPSFDIIEIDAASNNSVEDIRNLREKVQIAPVNAPKKIYIIDEVHMLSRSAFNALLQTLEEPPAHVVFILATTNPNKLPATIISRTQHFAFRNFPVDTIVNQLKYVAKQEKLTIEPAALTIIATQANGGMRDALSLLDQVSSLGKDKEKITANMVTEVLGLAPVEAVDSLIKATLQGDFSKLRQTLDILSSQSISGAALLDQLVSQILIQIETTPALMELLAQLSKLDKKEDYLDIRILTTLGLFSANSNKPSSSSEAPKSKPKIKVSPLVVRPDPVISELPVEPPKHTPSTTTKSLQDFDWSVIIDATKDTHMALASLVVKCKHHLVTDEEKLVLYTMNKFNKKKLDDPKYLPQFYSILNDLGFSGLTIETIPSGPPKGAVESKIADIMGGGEMVEVDI